MRRRRILVDRRRRIAGYAEFGLQFLRGYKRRVSRLDDTNPAYETRILLDDK